MAGAFHMIATPLPRRLLGALGGALASPADGFRDSIQALRQAGRVHPAAGHQDAVGLQAVDSPELDRIDARLQRKLVNALLQARMHLRHAEASHRPADRMIRVHTVAVAPHMGHFIGTGAAVACRARDVDAVFGVGASVPVELVLHCQQVAARIAAHLEVRHKSLAHEGCKEFLLAGQAQLDRPTPGLRGDGDRERLHGDAGLAAEAAADKGGHNTDRALRHAQGFGDQISLRKG